MKRAWLFGVCALVLSPGCAPELDDAASDRAPAARAYAATDADLASHGFVGTLSGDYYGTPFEGTYYVKRFVPREDGVRAVVAIKDVHGDLPEDALRELEQRELEMAVGTAPRLLAQEAPAPDGGAPTDDGTTPSEVGPDGEAETCPVLTLTLEPLHIELLGLMVDLQQLKLEVTAKPGQRMLLGDLLCEVAGLLDPDGLLGKPSEENITRAADLLGQVLGELLSGIVGGLVDGLSGGGRFSGTSSESGGDNSGSDNGGSENTGSDNGGIDNGGSDNSGGENAGSDNTGGQDSAGSENTGGENTGSDNTGGQDSAGEDSGSQDSGSQDGGSQDGGSQDGGSQDGGSQDGSNQDSDSADE